MKYVKYILVFIIGFLIDKLLDKYNKRCEYMESLKYNYIPGILWVILFHFKGFNINTILFALATSFTYSSSKIDIKYEEIPDLYNLILAILGFVYMCINKNTFKNSICGGVYLFVFLSLVMILSGSLGAGDVKMSGVGFFIGKKLLLNFTIFAFLSGAIFGIILLVIKKKEKDDTFPFGPFISLSAYITYLFY